MEEKNTEIIETVEEAETEPEKKSNYPTQVALTIRAIVGGYVVYLAYQIITSKNALTVPMWIAAGVFIVAGIALVVMSVKHYICGEYEGGKKDI